MDDLVADPLAAGCDSAQIKKVAGVFRGDTGQTHWDANDDAARIRLPDANPVFWSGPNQVMTLRERLGEKEMFKQVQASIKELNNLMQDQLGAGGVIVTQVRFAEGATGLPTANTRQFTHDELPALKEKDVAVKMHYVSIDPATLVY